MKSVRCVSLFLLVCGVVIFKSHIHCAPTGKQKQIFRSRFVEVDLKDIYQRDLEVTVDRHKKEVRKITPRNKKLISLVKVDEEIIWKRSGNSRCMNLLLFLTSNDKMIVILNTRSDGQKQYVNIVYDPTGGEGEEESSSESGGKRITYIGLLPLLAQLNENFGTMERYRREIFGVELNIRDKFDKWYYKYTKSKYILHSGKSKPVLKYAVYEPNEMELFVKITNDHRSIWLANPIPENIRNFCKKVEVYLKETSFKLMRLTMVQGPKAYYKYNFITSRWVRTDQKQFEEVIKYLGFGEVLNDNQEMIESRLPTEIEGTDAKEADPDKSADDKTDNMHEHVDSGAPSVENKDQSQTGATGIIVTEKQSNNENREDIQQVDDNSRDVKESNDECNEVKQVDEKGIDVKQVDTEDNKSDKRTDNAADKAEEQLDKEKGDDEVEEVEVTIPSLNIWDINSEDFYIIKRKMSLLRMVTIIPKEKRKVEKLYFNDYDFRYINSSDFKIEFIKWKNSFHITETIVKYNDRKNYFMHYLDKERGEHIWKSYTQDEFYRKIIQEISYFDVDSVVQCHHFALLDDLSKIANEPNYKKLINRL